MKLSPLFIALILSLSMIPFGLAQAVDVPLIPNTINPGNIFYGLDVAADNIKLAFTPAGLKKARLAIEIAEERRQEMQDVSTKPELIEKANLNREKALNLALNQPIEDSEKAEINQRLNNHIQVLERVRQNLAQDGNPNNDNALPSLQRAIDRSIERISSRGENRG